MKLLRRKRAASVYSGRDATVYQRGSVVLVSALARTVTGLLIETDPRSRFDEPVITNDLGLSVTAALAAFKLDMPHPDWKADDLPNKPLQKLAGVRSWRAFVQGTRCIGVHQDPDGTVIIQPYKNEGARQGFSPLDELEPFIAPTTDALGAHVLQGLNNAE
ncbi:hypothetical protein [Planotetraspora kaengkrachanensis]|uniref:Uncharacterized protein n=1 Tax=Planotetraspora kaengkrachanensis TaxID=575193 RepID=A0A8J3PSP6_9ACTN|nr:hypothetical protein [Planotetraspora kaengkrachanensis]GIG78491.1 hypothetical protein Pka01_16180 [Planotetraspora kaengkrachanensis]